MNVIQKFRSRQRDMKTLSKVITSSLERAQREGTEFAGAQHLAMSALEMEDGTAERAFVRIGSSGAAFLEALRSQGSEALRNLGISQELVDTAEGSADVGTGKFGKSDATFEAAVQQIYQFHNEADDHRRLLGSHILAGAVSVERGVLARTLKAMDISRQDLIEATREEFG